MGIPGSANPMLLAGAAGAYQINQSLRFNSADSAYLNRTPASAGNRKTWTWSGWVKRCAFGSVDNCLFSAYGNGTQSAGIYFSNDVQNDSLEVRFGPYSGGWQGFLVTAQVFRDPSAWYHIVFAADTTQATSSDRLKLYINGSQVTTFNSSAYPSQNTDGFLNQAQEHQIGRLQGNTYYHDGYLAEVNFIDGTALTPSSFGETDTITGAWIPKKYSGSYGTNGFYLKFESSGIGTDSSGNGNTWTANNFSTSGTGTDVMSDTPTTNWCTLNPISLRASFNNDCNDGNLGIETIGGNWDRGTKGTIGASSGKWYWEYTHGTIASGYPTADIGITKYQDEISANTSGGNESADTYLIQGNNGNKYNAGSGSSYGSAFTTGDICNIALDLDNGKVWFGKNGTYFNSGSPSDGTNAAFTGLSGTFWPLFYWGVSAGTSGVNQAYFNFGAQGFAYTPPTGYKALNTANLPEPTIKDGGAHFNTVLYTGNGSTQSITGVGFQPDWIWCKTRNSASQHTLTDAVRGADRQLWTSSTNSEQTNSTQFITSFDSDGFTSGPSSSGTGNTNENNVTFVAWNWKANGAGSSNNAGTITSTVSANASAGFSIATYTGNGTAGATVGHGLGVAPRMIMVKRRDTGADWAVYHASTGATKYLTLNNTNSAGTSSAYWNNTEPTSTLFSLGLSGEANTNGGTYVAYCFSEVAGYSKFGFYTGNGSTDGPFVFLGFRPRWVLIKSSSASGESWILEDSARDTYNPAARWLYPNYSDAESNGLTIDFLSNGFKPRISGTSVNTSSTTYIFAAFSETAFKYANAR